MTIWKVSGAQTIWELPYDFWILLMVAGATALLALTILTYCMKRYDATYTSGAFSGSLVVSASVMSAIHYHTFQHLEDGWVGVLYPVGLITLLIGVYILVKYSIADDGHHHNPGKPQDSGGDAETAGMLSTQGSPTT